MDIYLLYVGVLPPVYSGLVEILFYFIDLRSHDHVAVQSEPHQCPVIFDKMLKKIAHNSTIPSLAGNKDIRPLQDLITAEKAVLVSYGLI